MNVKDLDSQMYLARSGRIYIIFFLFTLIIRYKLTLAELM